MYVLNHEVVIRFSFRDPDPAVPVKTPPFPRAPEPTNFRNSRTSIYARPTREIVVPGGLLVTHRPLTTGGTLLTLF